MFGWVGGGEVGPQVNMFQLVSSVPDVSSGGGGGGGVGSMSQCMKDNGHVGTP